MGATLAVNGIDPVTKQEVLDGEARPMSSVMRSCGVYDYAG
eukprot:CAMPEP_0202465254 /NCGR_PEP_ID=MMETSP1360-20130828/64996_1 /ASSEMBLY_ACC=CAM_ASM_000848 /TAXON_ID=515479 /ORGANISM="Licmophora paradoxa, Strain CCMP2313" /LENGTH=40 /DNA_ID= /DNA_START= /DNA_END= /DNA_ORIENTATION=